MSGAALPSLPDPDRVLFASDMHLDDRHPALVERFLTELAARLQAISIRSLRYDQSYF